MENTNYILVLKRIRNDLYQMNSFNEEGLNRLDTLFFEAILLAESHSIQFLKNLRLIRESFNKLIKYKNRVQAEPIYNRFIKEFRLDLNLFISYFEAQNSNNSMK
jgi:hypothetical protein